jgi:hypothetical protein
MPRVDLRMARRWGMRALVLAIACVAATSAWAHGPGHRGGVHFWFGFVYGYPGWPAYYPPYYPYPPWPYPYAGWVAYPPPYVDWIDLDVVPEEAEVYVGGALLGTADDFDGFPDYLALRPGTHVITLRHPGYEDLRLRVKVVPGARVRVQRRMAEIASGRR